MIQAAPPASSPPPQNPLKTAVEGLADRVLHYAIALAVVGALSMALIEALKKLFDVRMRFHSWRWTKTMCAAAAEAEFTDDELALAYAQLIQLSTGVTLDAAGKAAAIIIAKKGWLPRRGVVDPSPAFAVFAQEPTALTALLQDAVDVALASPVQYAALYHLATIGADAADVGLWETQGKLEMEKRMNLSVEERDAFKATLPRELANAYGRLRQMAKRRLDGFQIYTEQQWASVNQLAANALGAVIMAIALNKIPITGEGKLNTLKLVGLSLIGGVLAPVAKDLVGALKKAKEP